MKVKLLMFGSLLLLGSHLAGCKPVQTESLQSSVTPVEVESYEYSACLLYTSDAADE